MLKRIRSLVSNYNFIEIYDNVLTGHECEILINQFEKSEDHKPGYLLDSDGKEIIDTDWKQSVEIKNLFLSDGSIISNIIKPRLLPCIDKYNRKYRSLSALTSWQYDEGYTFKKFEGEDAGFKKWHTEHCVGSLDRIFVWAFYLNNAKSGTEFMHYPTVRAKLGSCVIWPSSWTHVHRSAPNKGVKYYVSGWVTYS